MPKGAKTFRVSGSSEVKIYMVYDPSQVAEPAGRAHWPLDANVDVVVVADTVSKDLHDLKVNNIQSQGGGLACTPCPAISWDIFRDPDPSHPPQHHTATDITWSPVRSTHLYVTPCSCPSSPCVSPQRIAWPYLNSGPQHTHSSLHMYPASHLRQLPHTAVVE